MNPSLRAHGRWLVVLLSSLSLVAGCEKSATKPNIPPAQTEFYVSATTGLDTNDGTSTKPFKTLTHAIAVADTDHWVRVAPGTYDVANGETFPLVLKAGQTLIGDTLNKGGIGSAATTIRGHGASNSGNPDWLDQYASIIGAQGASISGFRIGSSHQQLHFAIAAHGVGVTISNNMLDLDSYGGVVLNGSGRSHIRANVFNTAAYGVYINACTDSVFVQTNNFIQASMPIDIYQAGGGVVVRGNSFPGGGWSGIQVQSGAPLIDYNSFIKPGGYATYGAILCNSSNALPKVRNNLFNCALGVRIMDGAPDLGTAGEFGGNNFMSVTGAAVKHEGSATIIAIGNAWQHWPPTAGVDIIVTGTGSVRWGAGAGEIVP